MCRAAQSGATAVSLPLSYLTLRATVLKVPITEKGKKSCPEACVHTAVHSGGYQFIFSIVHCVASLSTIFA